MMLGNRENLIGCEYFSTINIMGHKNIATAKLNKPKLKKVVNNYFLFMPNGTYVEFFFKAYVEN